MEFGQSEVIIDRWQAAVERACSRTLMVVTDKKAWSSRAKRLVSVHRCLSRLVKYFRPFEPAIRRFDFPDSVYETAHDNAVLV